MRVKALLHEAIFPATCNATNVALRVAKTVARATPHSQLAMHQNVALQVLARKVELSSTFRSVARQVVQVTCPTQLAMFFIRQRSVASCRENASCNMALT